MVSCGALPVSERPRSDRPAAGALPAGGAQGGDQLHAALTSRIVIEQAKGVLAERAQIGVDAAFVMLRAHAREKTAAAHQLIDGRLDHTALANAPVTASSSRG